MRKVDILNNTSKGSIFTSIRELEKYFSDARENSLLVFDWETTGLEYDATPLLMSMCFIGDNPVIVPIDYYFHDGLSMSEVADVCSRYFPKFRLIAHNAKYDSMISKVNGIKESSLKIYADTLIMIHLYNPDLEKKLETRVKIDFGFEKKTFEEWITPTGARRKRKWTDIDWAAEGDYLEDILASYSCEDAYFEGKVYEKYSALLTPQERAIHDKIEIPLIDILRDAKIRGVKINKELLLKMDEEARDEELYLLDSIYDECGCVFNLSSPKQKKEVFFDKLKYPVIYKTSKGAPATDSATYREWAAQGLSIGTKLDNYSKVHKLITGYLDTIPQLLDKHNVLRGDLNSCGTATGRFASSNPNLQNQPNNPKYPVRKAFIPRDGYVLVNYDYSQLELRVLTHFSRDASYAKVFNTGGDPHGDVAKRLGIPRKHAKVINFGISYGMTAKGLAGNLKISEEQAQAYINNYYKTYSGYAKWEEETKKIACRCGYSEGIFGRRRYFSELTKDPFHRDNYKYFSQLREVINTTIQGSGADIMKRATVATIKRLKEEGVDAHFLLQVHDENLFEAKIGKDAFECERIMIDCMENTTKLFVPLIADGKMITNWAEMHDDNIVSAPYRFNYPEIMTLL